MQIEVTSSEGLQRQFRVVIPASELQARLDAKIEEVRPQLRLNGFRPGKVPAAHVRKLYGPAMLNEIIDSEVNEATKKALEDGELRIAMAPNVELDSDMNQVAAGQADFAFKLKVELLPNIEPADLSTIDVVRLETPVEEAQVDTMLADLVKSNRTFEEKDGAAAEGDAVVIDFVGKLDGEPFEGGAAEKATVEIGAKRFIPGFEEGLIGAFKGDARTVSATFPEEYGVDHLKGKTAEFDVTVHEVRGPKEGVADDELAKKFGMETLEDLRKALRSSIESEHQQQSRNRAKRALFDKLDGLHEFPLPPAMVDSEFAQIWRQVEGEKERGQLDEEDSAKSEDELRADYRKIAERRVKLGLLLAEIGRRAKIEITDEEVGRAVMQQARQFPGQERQIIEIYQKNPNMLAQVRAPLFEEKTVDYMLELAPGEKQTVDRETLFADPEE